MENRMTDSEKELCYLVHDMGYEKDTAIGIALMSRKLNITDKTIVFLKKNPNASSEEVIEFLQSFI